jgi:hypothetical protein
MKLFRHNKNDCDALDHAASPSMRPLYVRFVNLVVGSVGSVPPPSLRRPVRVRVPHEIPVRARAIGASVAAGRAAGQNGVVLG